MFRLQACQKGRGIAIQLANPPLSLMGSLYQGLKTQVKERVLAIHQGRLLAIQGCHVGLKTHNPKQLATLCQGAQKNTMTQRFEIYVFFLMCFFILIKRGCKFRIQLPYTGPLYRFGTFRAFPCEVGGRCSTANCFGLKRTQTLQPLGFLAHNLFVVLHAVVFNLHCSNESICLKESISCRFLHCASFD